MFSLEDQISEVIRLSILYDQNVRSLDDLQGVDRSLGTDFWDMRTRQYWLQNFGEDSLKSFLNDADEEDLKRIVSVLYSGRSIVAASEQLKPADVYYQEGIETWNKTSLIAKIMELSHSAREKYLREGIRFCHENEINLNDLVL